MSPYASSSYSHKKNGLFHLPKVHLTLPHWLGGSH